MTVSLSTVCMLILLYVFFNDTATTEIYTLSLHDALPISVEQVHERAELRRQQVLQAVPDPRRQHDERRSHRAELHHVRSEEHTSELQSRQYLVCRLLLEKKKNTQCHHTIYLLTTHFLLPP